MKGLITVLKLGFLVRIKMRRNKSETDVLRIQAEELWFNRTPITSIAKTLKITSATIYRWIKKYKWDEKELEVIDQIRRDMKIDVEGEKIRSLSIIRIAEDRYVKHMANLSEFEDIPRSTTTIAMLLKVKNDILTPRTITNQTLNITKNENLNVSKEVIELLEATKDGTGFS